MQKLLKIYLGVPLKFYFGNENYEKFEHFYHYEEAGQLVKDIFEEYIKVGESSE